MKTVADLGLMVYGVRQRSGPSQRELARRLDVSQPSTPEAATAFFGGLLPEGSGRSNLEALTDEQIAERLTVIHDHALGAVGGGGSLAGYQPKTTLALLDGVWHAGDDGAASTHILKPVAAGNEHALHAEAFCLELSRRIGYDRRMAGRSLERIHQEVGAQALGLRSRQPSKTSRSSDSIFLLVRR
ncbi:hypothetical protein ABIB17_000237 [Arthrobacter sp. UYEF6]